MSIGICDLNKSKARVLGFALLCSASLSACSNSNGAGFSFAPKSEQESRAEVTGPVVPSTTHTTLARGSIRLKAPKGYCIDETSISNGLQGSSAMLARCSSLNGKGADAGVAVMAVSVSPRRGADASAPTIQDLTSAAAPNKVLQHVQKGNLALVQLASGGNEVLVPASPVHWRGATTLDTRLILLSLFAPEGSALTGNDGATLLASLAKGISAKRGSFLGSAGEQSSANQPKSVSENFTPDTVDPAKKGAKGLIARLLNRS
ncbi:MAG: hypothetical protein WBC85_16515 [Planktotalea sp.]|uniref:hypothetical protein n=1 Tax=Planktotalea sp. TaxID=2029877 RepID=UPI003C76417A